MVENQIKLLQTLRTKVEVLMQRCTQLTLREAMLQQQLQEREETIEALRNELKVTQSKYQHAKMAQTLPFSNDEEKRKMKLHINGLVREIDKCITRLNGTMQ